MTKNNPFLVEQAQKKKNKLLPLAALTLAGSLATVGIITYKPTETAEEKTVQTSHSYSKLESYVASPDFEQRCRGIFEKQFAFGAYVLHEHKYVGLVGKVNITPEFTSLVDRITIDTVEEIVAVPKNPKLARQALVEFGSVYQLLANQGYRPSTQSVSDARAFVLEQMATIAKENNVPLNQQIVDILSARMTQYAQKTYGLSDDDFVALLAFHKDI